MGVISYNTVEANLTSIYRATSGGTVFSANIVGASFDYFTDTPAVNDAIYFGMTSVVNGISDIKLNIGTPMAGTDIVLKWEYFNRAMAGTVGAWVEIPNLTDGTNALTTTGINIIKFPPPAYMWYNQPTNLSGVFMRCRLVSFTTVTEGGANATTIPTKKNGQYTLTGFSASDRPTAQILYDWSIANAPEIPVFKRGNYYEFPVGGTFQWFFSTRETILFCNGAAYLGVALPDAQIGYSYSNTGYGGSTIMVCGYSGGTVFSPSTGAYYNTKMYAQGYYDQYNDVFITPTNGYITKRAGYGSTQLYGSIVEEAGYFDANTNFTNTVNTGSMITIGNMPDNTKYLGAVFSNATGGLFNMYNSTTYNMRGAVLDYAGAAADFNSTTFGATTLNLFDCTKLPVPSYTSPKPLNTLDRSVLTTTANIKYFHYYDDSAGTYTNYTTQIVSDTTNDVPMTGDVGDIFYIGVNDASIEWKTEQLTIRTNFTVQDNDYEYVWEFNHPTLGWTAFTNVWDRTYNFTTTGDEITIFQYTSAVACNQTQSTINGTTDVFIRARIVTKGTDSPTISRMRRGFAYGYQPDWRVNEYYSLDIHIVDAISKLAIEDAGIVVKDINDSSVVTTTTDSSGDIATQNVKINYYDFDPWSTDRSFHKQTLQTPHTITISKAGYQTKILPIEILEKTSLTISLEKSVDVVIAKGIVAHNPTPSSSRPDVFI